MKTREVKLGEVANVKGGKRIPKGIGLINIPNGHPYIRVRDLNNKRLLELDNSYEYVDNETCLYTNSMKELPTGWTDNAITSYLRL